MKDLTPEHKAFLAHLDVCEQCREQPLNLCAAGVALIHAAVRSIREKAAP